MNIENNLGNVLEHVWQQVFPHIMSLISLNTASGKIDNLDSHCSAMENAAAEDSRVIENMHRELKNFTKTVEEGLAQIMSKIDLLELKRVECSASANFTSTNTPTTTSFPSAPISAASPSLMTQAAEKGNVEVLLKLLKSGVSVQERDENNDSALHLAAARGHLHGLIALLESGAVIDAPGNLLRTPLHCAAIGGHIDVVRRLLAAGASIDIEDMSGDTALGAAVRAGKWRVVKILLLNGASCEGSENLTSFPLCRASEAGEVDIVRIMLNRKSLWSSSELGRVLSFAKNDSVVSAFKDELSRCVQSVSGVIAMLHAASKGRHHSMIALLNAGVDLQASDAQGNALSRACFSGHVECVKVLLRRRVKTDIKDKKGFTPLHNAAIGGHATCVRLLLKAGADKNARCNAGHTPLDLASTIAVRNILLCKAET